MAQPTVFVTRLIPDRGLDLVKEACDAEIWEDELPPPYEVLLEKVADKEGLLSLLTDTVNAQLMDAAPNLKVISNYAVGFDNIEIEEATKRGLPVGNTPGVLTDTTADFAFAMIMATGRRIVEGADYVRAGKWKTWGPRLLAGQDIHGATLGIVGFGRIGQAVAKRAQGFDMRVVAYDIYPDHAAAEELGVEFVDDMDVVLRQADFLTVHTQLTDETYHLIGKRELQLMKPTAILVNTSRGPCVDPDALYRALRDGEIAYAGLDVTEPEPIDRDSPLLELDNCVVVPHIASASVATRGKMAEMAAQNLIAGVRGERLPTCVNPEVYG
ncbi:MAG: Glyoxylate/hydroxypyruvate reductase B [Anaerolineales bacterium]|nr:Glyoxylate/hydroxypyruvate reductase B [Anaerolineales bacterium]